MYDLIVRKGLVIDGTGQPGFPGDVAIEGDRIVAVGDLSEQRGRKEINASGLVVCPGFIDLHSHSDLGLLAEPDAVSKVMQGITTEAVGQDGYSMAPLRKELVQEYRRFIAGLAGFPEVEWDWESVAGYLARCNGATSTNVVTLVGHGTLRMNVLGANSAPASPGDLDRMGALIEQAFAEGASDVSYGLIYVPSLFADLKELESVGRAVQRLGGAVVYHLRNESDFILESLAEVLDVARDTGVRTHISHLKVTGAGNWPRAEAVMGAIDGALAEGLDVTFEQYPYTAGSTMMSALLPPWVLEGGASEALRRLRDSSQYVRILLDLENGVGRWQSLGTVADWNVVLSAVGSSRNQDKVGRTLRNLAEEAGSTPPEVAIRLLSEEELNVSMIIFHQSEEVVRRFMSHARGSFGTDGLMGGRPHPRLYGSYPRILGRYVREAKVLRMEEAIRKATSAASDRLRLADRGRLAAGNAADIVVFNPHTVMDTATYEEPRQSPVGIEWVLVNGTAVVAERRHTGAHPGRSLKPHVGTSGGQR